MGQALDHLRQALANDQELNLEAVGGAAAITAAAAELAVAPEIPIIVDLVIREWSKLPDRSPFVELIANCVRQAGPLELDDVLDMVLSSSVVVPDVAGPIVRPIRERASAADAAAGIALEGWLRLNLGQWTTTALPFLAALMDHAASAAEADDDNLDQVFLQRLVRCLGAAGEQWRSHNGDMMNALRGLLHHPSTDDNVAFELAMLQLRSGLEQAEPESAVTSLREARQSFALCAQYEDRVDAEAFGTAIDAVLAFVSGSVPSEDDVRELRSLVIEYRLGHLAEAAHWRQPRADTSVQWLDLVDRIARLQDLDHGWMTANMLIGDIAKVYEAHRTLTLLQPADVLTRSGAILEKPPLSPALPTLLQPRIERAVARQDHGIEMLSRWLSDVAASGDGGAYDVDAIRHIHDLLNAGGPSDRPKGQSVDLSALTELTQLDETARLTAQEILNDHPDLARTLNAAAAVQLNARQVDSNIYFQQTFANLREQLAAVSGIDGEPAARVEQMALALLKYVRWRGSTTPGSKLGASFQKPFSRQEDAPEEAELRDDLHRHLAMTLQTVPLREVSHIANGRIDLAAFYGCVTLVIECKRELDDATKDHLSALYTVQPAEYAFADLGVGFLVVLDLTPKQRRAKLHQSVWVVSVPPAEEGGGVHAVMVARVQANVQSPSYSSKPSVARRRAAKNS